MSLALSTLIYEWRRYLAAVIALAFSGLLVLAQVGMFLGIGQSFTATVDRSPAHLFVLPPNQENVLQGGMPARNLPRIYMHPEVVEVRDIDVGGGTFRNIVNTEPGADRNSPEARERRKQEGVLLMAIDPEPGAVTVPTDYPEHVVQALQQPYTVAIDQTALARLGVRLGDRATINGRSVRVAAVLNGYPNMMQPTLATSRQTLRLLRMAYPADRTGSLLVRLRDPSRAEIVRDQLNAESGDRYRVWTRAELSRANETAMFQEQIIGVMLGFSALLGLFIGVGITSQTLRGAILANIKEFASLRALGVSMGSLRRIVLELALWVGVVGLAATALLTAGVAALAGSSGVPMAFSPPFVIAVAVLLMVISILSGMMSLGVLKKSQPADLLR